MTRQIHRSEFVRQLRAALPEVEPYLTLYRLGTTQEMAAFFNLTSAAIDQGDRQLVKRCFHFAGVILAQGNADVRGALTVAFLEHLDFDGPSRSWAEELLPTPLQEERGVALEYVAQITANLHPRVSKAPKPRRRPREQGRRVRGD